MKHALKLLWEHNISVGLSGKILYPDDPQVVHAELYFNPDDPQPSSIDQGTATGDVFIFPSGTVVSWGIPSSVVSHLTGKILRPAARGVLGANSEDEDLEYIEEENEPSSFVKGETIVLGMNQVDDGLQYASTESSPSQNVQSRRMLLILSKIAFSSGLARATKLSVLENLVEEYFESTRSILSTLKRGGFRLRSRKYVYEKIGQLLDLRAQLNLYSELTDDLPDLFWDTRQELGMERYYDQVGKALDTDIRIRALNQKIDYGESIVHSLRDMRSEIHSSRLEKIIIALITSEIFLVLWTEFRIPAIAEGIGGANAEPESAD